MDLIQAIILGIIQGVTEWLPISSSGHLVIFETILGLRQPVVFDVLIHLGSVLVVLAVFWKDIMQMIAGFFRLERRYLLMAAYIVMATIPIALVGFFLQDQIEAIFKSLLLIGVALIFTGFLLLFSKYPIKKNKSLDWKGALGMGAAQAVAILPGVSRSGSTIATGMMLGFKREEVARFSFLMFIPAILGAAVLEISKGALSQVQEPMMISVGVLVAAITGFFSLKLLLSIIKKGNFSYFAYYCFIVGASTICLSLFL